MGLKELIKTRDIIFTAMGSGIKKPSTIENLSAIFKGKVYLLNVLKKGSKNFIRKYYRKRARAWFATKIYRIVSFRKKVIRDVQSDHPLTWDDLLN